MSEPSTTTTTERVIHIVGHEHTYVEFDVIRRSDVNQNPAADCYTLTADIPAVGSLLEPHSQLPMDQHDELINQIVQVRHILKGFRRRDPSQKNRSMRITAGYFPIAGNHANPKPRPTFYRVPHDASTSGRICGLFHNIF